MWRQLVVLSVGLVVLVSVGTRVLRNARETGTVRLSAQLLVGVLCGVVGAVVVMVPNGDAVPDDLEVPLSVAAFVAVVAFAGTTARPRRSRPPPRRSGRGQGRPGPGGSRVRSPGEPRDATSRMHSGP